MPSPSSVVPPGTNSGATTWAERCAIAPRPPSLSCRGLQSDERLDLIGILDVEDGHLAIFGHVDLLRVVHDVLQVLLESARRVQPDHEDVVAIVVGHAGEEWMFCLDLRANLLAGDFHGRDHIVQIAAEVVEVAAPLRLGDLTCRSCHAALTRPTPPVDKLRKDALSSGSYASRHLEDDRIPASRRARNHGA